MKTRILALLLILALSACLFAGCAKTEEPAAQPAPVEEPAAEAPAEETPTEPAPVEEAPAEETPAEEAPAEPAPDAAPAEPAPEPVASLAYPLTNGDTITAWCSFFGALDNFIADSDYNNMYIIPFLEEGSGVNVEFTTVSDTIASEQFNLMVASGDWPDYSGAFAQMYSGGLLQAYEDEVIMSLEDDYLAEFAPDYWAVRSVLTGDDLATALEGGMNLGVYTISDQSLDTQGMLTRTDWYTEQGSPDLSTLDAFTDYLYACYEAYGCDSALHMEDGGSPGYIDDAFGVIIPSYAASSVPYYVDNGEIKCNLVADGYYDYLQWFHQLYADKVINADFYSRSMMTYQRFTYIADGQIAVWPCNAGSVNDQNIYLTAGQAPIEPQPLKPVTDGDGVNNWATRQSIVSGCYSISADCTNPEATLAFMNYLYTDEGAMYGNYGVEGFSYEYNDAGEPVFTTLITENEFSTMPENAVRGYLDEIFPVRRFANRLWSTYDDNMHAAAEAWTGNEVSYDHAYPAAGGLTTAEQDSITNASSDIMTYVSTEILNFMTGNETLDETTWAAYCADLERMGLSGIMAVYQVAYDEAIAGER